MDSPPHLNPLVLEPRCCLRHPRTPPPWMLARFGRSTAAAGRSSSPSVLSRNDLVFNQKRLKLSDILIQALSYSRFVSDANAPLVGFRGFK
ncbi:hypothetical protein RIF29_15872 [Crotalaria pallida]|uniref:Uncharacterized protein n=1 Tax=Crotalaria pallida TaxID=3830 RepID=A0AAN9FMM7_CROPI